MYYAHDANLMIFEKKKVQYGSDLCWKLFSIIEINFKIFYPEIDQNVDKLIFQ